MEMGWGEGDRQPSEAEAAKKNGIIDVVAKVDATWPRADVDSI